LILAKVYEELTSLELEMERAVIWTYNAEDRSVRWWAANPEAESGSVSYFIADQDDPVYNAYWKAWEERRTKYLYILEGEYKENWTDILFNKTEVGRLPDIVKAAMVKPEKLYLYNTFNDFGVLFISCLEPLPEDKFTILERFGKVFDQSYTRFNDIKQAEARAQEAIKQSSLDRVRGQIASMRSTADLDRITPLVWDELTTLGVPFIRCGVFIIDEASQIVKAYLSSPKGESLGVLNLPFTASTLTSDSVDYWRKKKVLHQHWNREEFVAWTASLMEQGLLKNRASYQGTSEPPESLDLHFIPFDQGMLYVGSEAVLSSFQIELVQALANAFSVAYARYEDFALLEKAKESVETTLHELKATQSQLVQSEKMASLGELTAGIAHEIQNPLNFVNNFSEVSKELLEEMMEEMEKGDVEEVKSIAEDVIQNLEKIVHHGKRADGIVKGMLQHSRASSGEKEPTDLNVLADEYLRLAYHGLRAKDKMFNANLETHFDEKMGKVNVMAQDIGRVILNLITNAFYVVKQKKEQQPEGYEPTVTVTTRKENDKVEISVKDNGNGIPKKVLDKIFQPFFTTKPTGEGTGLGLSMSYDIVTKGHGGELEVKTKEGEGSEFIISLPIVRITD
ncbi:MAG: ATP-binding protein, partial [Maribacter sp.]|nr:ATP-binding protein [Maribacter sp.]